MVDEAQDTNPAFAGVIANQRCQVIMVGDESQAIYGWRGARDAMTGFNAPHVANLSQSFRFGQAVADVANVFLTMLDAPIRVKGLDSKPSKVEALDEPSAVLTRTNAAAIEAAMDAAARGRSVAFVGKMGAEIKSFADAADKLMSGKRVMHADLSAFKSWAEVQAYAATDEGRDLRMMVKLVDTYGTGTLRKVAEDSVREADADVVISTAHKSKGREWDHVKIGSDFAPPEEGNGPSRPELMLLYVAVTRAKLTLDAGALSWAF
jgi:superfamily I DNA/RNA helicase